MHNTALADPLKKDIIASTAMLVWRNRGKETKSFLTICFIVSFSDQQSNNNLFCFSNFQVKIKQETSNRKGKTQSITV